MQSLKPDTMTRLLRILELAEQHSKHCADPKCHLKEVFS